MAEMFSGDWTVEVFQRVAKFRNRFVIEGSLASDGPYPAELGMFVRPFGVSVSGPSWFIRLEWNFIDTSGVWRPRDVRRTGAAYTLEGGLVVSLGVEKLPDFDFHPNRAGVILRCRNVDPRLNPWHPFANPYDFTLPEDVRQPGRR